MATTDLAEKRVRSASDTHQQAVRAALNAVGEPYASEMAEGVSLEEDQAS